MTNINNRLDALYQARYAFDHKESMSLQAKYDAVQELSEWDIFSTANIAHFIHLDFDEVLEITRKPTRPGSFIAGETLSDLIELAHKFVNGEVDKPLIRKVLEAGTSIRGVTLTTGFPHATVQRARFVGTP